jgi:mitochondrial protein import protein ZIM17
MGISMPPTQCFVRIGLRPQWGLRDAHSTDWPAATALAASRRSNRRGDEDRDIASESTGIPQLPPTSSLPKDFDTAKLSDKPFVANHKFQLQYTCNICETRNYHNVSRIAYRQGVVITRCKGCDSQHLIADNLGWTDYDGGFQGNKTNTIEDYFAGDENVQVSRVSTEVFELEKILQSYDSKSGAIIGDDGKLALE